MENREVVFAQPHSINPENFQLQAMILSAGLGTRLRPLTFHIPKPLFPVLNQPLVERLCLSLEAQGFRRIFINTFHLSEHIEAWHSGFRPDHARVILVKEPELLGTGGGIQNVFACCCNRDMPLLVINGDVVTDVSLKQLYEIHRENEQHTGLLASMVVHSREPWNKLHVKNGFVSSFRHEGSDALAFTGISVLSPAFMKNIPSGPGSVIAALEAEMARGGRVKAVMASEIATTRDRGWIWEDIGSPSGYINAHEKLICRLSGSHAVIDSDSLVADDFVYKEWVCIGRHAVIGPHTALERCVVWEDAVVPQGSFFKNSIITPYGSLDAGQGVGAECQTLTQEDGG